MKRTIAASVLLLATIGLTTGCTTGGGTSSGSSSNSGSNSSSDTSNARTYDAADLGTILTSAEKTLGVSGQISTDKDLKDAAKSLGAGAGGSAMFGGAKVTYSPKACGTLVASVLSTKPDTDSIGSALIYNTTALTVVTKANAALPAEYTTDLTKRLDDFISQCGSVTLKIDASGTQVGAKLSLTKIDAKTTADQTYAIQEAVTVSGDVGKSVPPIEVTIIQARSGNLFISAAGSASTGSSGSTASLVKAVDAAVKAADELK